MAKKSTKKSSEPKIDESSASGATKNTSSKVASVKSDPSATNVVLSKNADTLQVEFNKLLEKFERADDAITRYMLRDELNQLKKDLDAKGIKVELP